MSNSGEGLGFRVKGNNGGFIAASYSSGAISNGTTQSISAGTTYLVVGEMIFNANSALDDTINIYFPSNDLTQGSVVVTQSATLTQTNFDTISFAAKGATTGDFVDEIRFGTSYADVTPVVPEPSAALLGGLGCLLLLRRRRA